MKINYVNEVRVNISIVPPTHPIAAQFGGVQVPAFYVFKKENGEQPVYSSKYAYAY